MGHRGNKRERKRGKKQRGAHEDTPGDETLDVPVAHEDGSTALDLSASETTDSSTSSLDAQADDTGRDDDELVDADGHRGRDTADAIDLTDLAQVIPEPPQPPIEHVPRTRSGIAPRIPVPASLHDTNDTSADDDMLNDHLVSLRPFYREGEARPNERADERVVGDAGLDLHAMYFGTPLYTPVSRPGLRERAVQVGKWVALSFVVLTSGYGIWSAAQHFVVAEASIPSAENRQTAPSQPAPAAPSAAVFPSDPVAEVAQQPTEETVPETNAEVDPGAQPSSAEAQRAALKPAADSTAQPGAKQAAAPLPAPSATTEAPKPYKREPEPPKAPAEPSAKPGAVRTPPQPQRAQAQAAQAAPASSVAAPASTQAQTQGEASDSSEEAGALESEQLATTQAAQPEPTGPLPKRPSAAVLRESFQRLRAPMGACVGGRSGVVKIRAVISGNGKLNSGTLEGPFDAPEQRACLTRTLFQLQVPPFAQEAFRVDYALVL